MTVTTARGRLSVRAIRRAVVHIELDSGNVLEEFDDVDIPARIVLAFDSVWVTESGGSQVFRIGPFTET